MTTDELTEKIMKLRSEGKKAKEIAAILNEAGETTPNGLKFNMNHVYNLISEYHSKNRQNLKLVMNPKKRPHMETLIAEEPRKKGKVVAIIAEADDVADFLRGWVGNG